MNLRDLDFSKRLPVNFQRSVEIPLFPQLRKSNIRSKSTNCNESSGYNPKRESTTLLKNDSVMKSPQNSKFSAWTEIVIPFSRSLKPRSYHSMVFYDKSIYIYGGYDINHGILFDFTRLKDEEDMKCEQVSLLGISPGKLYRHGACIYQKRMFVFGGKKGVSENSNDIYFYDFEEKLWAHIFIDVNKPKPPKLDSFSLNLDKTHENIIVFGGFYGKFTNRLFFFFLKENRWEEIAAKGVCPAKRAGHSSVLHNDTHLYISGGGNFKQKFNDLWCLEIIKSVWIQIAVNERIYQPGVGTSMVLHKDFLIIFGGIVNISHEKNDLVLYNLKKDSWKQISFDSDDDIDIFEFNKILGKPIKKSESKSGLVPQKSNIKIPKLVLNNSVSSSFSNKKSSLKEIINKLSIKNKIKKANTFHEHDNQNYNEIKNHSLNNPEKSRNYLMNTSTLLKKILCPVVIVKDKIWEKKKRILLNEFEILDEKIRKEFLIITPTTKIMNSTIAIFKCASKLEGINKRKKILPISQFKMKEITLRIIGNVPCPRDGHTALVIRNKMVIIGGDRHQRQYHDIYECNLNMLID